MSLNATAFLLALLWMLSTTTNVMTSGDNGVMVEGFQPQPQQQPSTFYHHRSGTQRPAFVTDYKGATQLAGFSITRDLEEEILGQMLDSKNDFESEMQKIKDSYMATTTTTTTKTTTKPSNKDKIETKTTTNNNKSIKTPTTGTTTTAAAPVAPSTTNTNVYNVKTVQDYRKIIDDSDKLTIVRFAAPFCMACKATEPLFQRMTRDAPDVDFVNVEITMDNRQDIHDLGVPSLPYGFIYHPNRPGHIVEQLSMNKRHFKDFANVVESYRTRECEILEDQYDETSGVYRSPYARVG